ncbi:FAD/NAD(P)-binding domain-containing protein [Piedraia hortae CBS 480.64]|uniref:FAD/NAD(P)-binding domain-containing protein n=1 Tax=Piedraia hortae CBS 480.64 TaxID=1314780 RepID=A0A6A7BVT2_9PEZI|nr:FAD/NAD(P)-binding domain-containing protein [Piedraia hortae CBS 480.64]
MSTKFKLPLPSLSSLKPNVPHEVSLPSLPDSKILLISQPPNAFALSPKCTHYGAPLSKGVLSPGRITCPWHGACFSLATGDVEDAPALDSLHRFDVIEEPDGVYVIADEADLKSGRRCLKPKVRVEAATPGVVIVGRGAGAVGAMEALRAGGYGGKIVNVAKEGFRPIDRTKLSKALATDLEKLAWRGVDFYRDAAIELVTDEVTGVDFENKKVMMKSGKEMGYEKLILSSGGTPNWLPLSGLGGELGNTFQIRTLEDSKKIVAAAGEEGGKKIVVIGSSFIGMEVGNCLASKKHHVTIVGMEKEPMERVMGAEVGSIFRKLLEKNGVEFYLGASVEKGIPSLDGKMISAVKLADGTELPADVVIEGVGVHPATEYLNHNSSITIEKDGSVSVDDRFAIKGVKDAYAVGDIASYPYYGPGGDGKPIRIEHWDVAQNAGRAVAQDILKPDEPPKRFIPVFWSAMGSQVRYCGTTAGSVGYDDIIIHGTTNVSEGKQSWIAYYCKGEQIVAVATMMKDPYMAQSAELMLSDKMPTKSQIKNGSDIMSIVL